MVIYDRDENVCGIYEVKHSDKAVDYQYRYLTEEEKCAITERRFGKIVKKCVLYRGEPFRNDDGIVYENVENYLKTISKNTFVMSDDRDVQMDEAPKITM